MEIACVVQLTDLYMRKPYICVWVKEEEAGKGRDIDWCLLVTAQEQGRIGSKIPLHS